MKEIRWAGFLDTDLLSVIYLAENLETGFMYVFNAENRGKVGHYLRSFSKDDKNDVSDWLSNRMTDEGLDVFCDVKEVYNMDRFDLVGNDGYDELEETIQVYRQKYPSIAPDMLVFEFKIEKS